MLVDVSSAPTVTSELGTEPESKEASQLDEDLSSALAALRSLSRVSEDDEVLPRPSTSTFASSRSIYSTVTAAYLKSRASSSELDNAPPRPSTSTIASSLSAYSMATTAADHKSPASSYFTTSSKLAAFQTQTLDGFSSSGEGDSRYMPADEWTKVSVPSTPVDAPPDHPSSSSSLSSRPKSKRNSSSVSSASRAGTRV